MDFQKHILPVAKKLITINALLALYYFMPNFTAFLFTALLLILLIQLPLPQSSQEDSKSWDPNWLLNVYYKAQIIRKVMMLVWLGLLVRLAYTLPSWACILLGVEVLVCWQWLVVTGCVQVMWSGWVRMQQSVSKLLTMIPRYEQQREK